MIQMQAQQNVGGIAGLAVLTPTVHGDDRLFYGDLQSAGYGEPGLSL